MTSNLEFVMCSISTAALKESRCLRDLEISISCHFDQTIPAYYDFTPAVVFFKGLINFHVVIDLPKI